MFTYMFATPLTFTKDGAGASELPQHPNTFSMSAVLRNAWLQIGKSRIMKIGIDGTCRALGILVVVASALFMEQKAYIDAQIDRMKKSRVCPVITRYYDCTPMRMAFGAMQHMLYPWARYPVIVGSQWKLLSLDEYLKLRRAGASRGGWSRTCACASVLSGGQADVGRAVVGGRAAGRTRARARLGRKGWRVGGLAGGRADRQAGRGWPGGRTVRGVCCVRHHPSDHAAHAKAKGGSLGLTEGDVGSLGPRPHVPLHGP